MKLVEYIAARSGTSRTKAKALLDARTVFVNGKRVWMARHTLRCGDTVEIRKPPGPGPASLAVLHEDAEIVVLDKPPGLLSTGAESAEERLRRQLDRPALRAVHRLDRDTSGCLLFAGSPETREVLVEAFRAHRVRKRYLALVHGAVSPRIRRINLPLEGRTAVTELRLIASSPAATQLSIILKTGRTHQIRKHLAALGHPVLGDRQYMGGKLDARARAVPRHMLHAETLAFPHPRGAEPVEVVAVPPADFRQCVARFGLSPGTGGGTTRRRR